MGFVNNYPYTDFHELNLDWILNEIKTLHTEWDDFKVINTIHAEGEWDISKGYEPWSLVTNNNIGYISVKPVPVGVSITNTSYWKEVANYDLLLADLQQRVVDIEQSYYNVNSNRRVVFLADSYGTVTSPTLPEMLRGYLGMSAQNFYNQSEYGASFSLSDSHTFLKGIQRVLPNVDADKITDIVVCGGYNDARFIHTGGTKTQVINDIRTFVEYCNAHFKNADVHIGFTGWRRFADSSASAVRSDLRNALSAYKDCITVNASYLGNVEYIMRNLKYINTNDLIHPVLAGAEALAKGIAEAFLKGSCDVNYSDSVGGHYTASFPISSGSVNLSTFISNGMQGMFSSHDLAVRLRPTALDSIAQDVWFEIFTDTNPLIWSDYANGVAFGIFNSDEAYGYESIEWKYEDGKFYIRTHHVHTNVSVILLRFVNTSIPSDL